MRKPDDRLRGRHMLETPRKAAVFIEGRSREDLDKDEILALALVRLVEVLGEAAKGVSDEFRGEHSHIPWRLIAGTRDRLTHGYYDVNLDIVWNIVTDDLPPLLAELERLVPEARP